MLAVIAMEYESETKARLETFLRPSVGYDSDMGKMARARVSSRAVAAGGGAGFFFIKLM